MTDNPYGVRVAVADDAAALLAFVLPIFAENAAQTVSPEKVAQLVERCISRDRAMAGIVTGPTGIDGSVGMTVDEFDYSDEPHVMVRWIGISPAVRRTNLGSQLMGFVRWFHETAAPLPVFLSSLTTTDLRSKVLMLQRQAPMVGVVHALGCLPDRDFLTPGQVTGGKGKRGGSRSLPPNVGLPVPSIAKAS